MDTKPNSLLHNPTHNPIPLIPPNKTNIKINTKAQYKTKSYWA